MILEYQIKYSNRKTLNISVERDRSIIVRAPHYLTADKIDKAVQSKRQWIKEKLNHTQKYPILSESKEFISGETLMYLGKNYQLLVIDEEIEGIDFDRRFKISKSDQPKANELFKKWYLRQAFKEDRAFSYKICKELRC